MNSRYYDPEIGIFMCPDPGMQGTNHYEYAKCNPIMYNDPTGLKAGGFWQTITQAVSKVVNYVVTVYETITRTETYTRTDPYTGQTETEEKTVTETIAKQEQQQKIVTDNNSKQVQTSDGNGFSGGSNQESRATGKVDYQEQFKGMNGSVGVTPSNGGDKSPNGERILQTDTVLNQLAKAMESKGLSNPARWACNFMSSVTIAQIKVGKTLEAKEIISLANNMYDKESLGENFWVKDGFAIINATMNKLGSNIRAAYTSDANKYDFTMLKSNTSWTTKDKKGNEITKTGFHFYAGDSKGNLVYDPDPSLGSKINVSTPSINWGGYWYVPK